MTSSIDRAKELLEVVVGQSPDCTCPTPENFHEEDCPWALWIRASITAESKVQIQAPDLLRGYIGAMGALTYYSKFFGFDPVALRADEAIAEFDKLFPEEVGWMAKLWMVETGEYDQRYTMCVADSPELAEQYIHKAYPPPFIVNWEPMEDTTWRGGDERYEQYTVTGHFAEVAGKSTRHTNYFTIEPIVYVKEVG